MIKKWIYKTSVKINGNWMDYYESEDGTQMKIIHNDVETIVNIKNIFKDWGD